MIFMVVLCRGAAGKGGARPGIWVCVEGGVSLSTVSQSTFSLSVRTQAGASTHTHTHTARTQQPMPPLTVLLAFEDPPGAA